MNVHKVFAYTKKNWRLYSSLFCAFLLSTFISIFILQSIVVKFSFSQIKNEKNLAPKNKQLKVVTGKATAKNVPVYLSALGSVTAFESVTVKTQINGVLLKVLFHEGQTVKAGDLLAQIDAKTYQAQVTQFEGQLLRDQSLLKNAILDLKRYKLLYPSGGISGQTLDTQKGLVKQYEGIVKSDHGQLEAAKINLNYCNIMSPISGLIGLRQVNPGNYVQISDSNGIAIINKLQPIAVIFSIPEDNLPKIIEKLQEGNKLLVRAYNREQTTLLSTGELISTDNQIDSSTGTIKLKALFQNIDFHLFPNQFVNIKLLVETLNNVTTVPTAAIRHGINGDYVFVLNSNQTVRIQKITSGNTDGDQTVVKEGISPNEFVVTEGADKLTDGAEVSL